MPEHDEKQKPTRNEIEFPSDRVAYYEGRAQEILEGGSREFHEFIKGLEELEKEGDKLVCLEEATGYNIILADNDMPLTSDRDLIFYNNYIGRPHHFGLLLANMEAKGIITPGDVRFGKKATKVIYDGSWELDPDDEFEEEISYTDELGELHKMGVERTVETVVIFSPKTKKQAIGIASYLLRKADKDYAGHIDESWKVPDIRATISLAKVLIRPNGRGFRMVVTNTMEKNGALLVALRQKTEFENEKRFNNPSETTWVSNNTTQNKKLAQFLANEDVQS